MITHNRVLSTLLLFSYLNMSMNWRGQTDFYNRGA